MKLVAVVVMTLFAVPSLAADFHWKLKVGSTKEPSSLSEGELKVKAGGWSCLVGKVSKGPIKGRESREVRCEYTTDVSVSFVAACSDRVEYDREAADLESKDSIVHVAISCER